jgi:hypothetical protein
MVGGHQLYEDVVSRLGSMRTAYAHVAYMQYTGVSRTRRVHSTVDVLVRISVAGPMARRIREVIAGK